MAIILNSKDIAILDVLQQNSSLTTQEIANQTNTSQSPCWRRINRMETAGVIDKNVSILNRNKLNINVVAFTTVTLSSHGRNNLEQFEAVVQKFPEVVECYTMAGIWDYILKIVTKDIRQYEIFLRNQLTTLEHIREIHSHLSVTEVKNTTALPLSTQYAP